MSKFAIVILYEGLKPSESTIKALHTALCESRVVYDLEKVEMYKMSEEEIMAAIIAVFIDVTILKHECGFKKRNVDYRRTRVKNETQF